jgi:hypothetical protein
VEEKPADASSFAWRAWFCRKTGYEIAWQYATLQERVPGFKVTPASESAEVSRLSPSAVSVKFHYPPKSNVTVTIASDNPSAGTATPSTLTFTPGNYSMVQSVTVNATNGNPTARDFNLTFTTASADSVFDGLVDRWQYTNQTVAEPPTPTPTPTPTPQVTPSPTPTPTAGNPDIILGRPVPNLGENIQNLSGNAQTLPLKISPGRKKTVEIWIKNTGRTSGSFTIQANRGNSRISAKYFTSVTNITGDVTGGTFTTPLIAPGEVFSMRICVRAASQATHRQQSFTVKVTSAAEPQFADVAVISARVN